MPGGGTPNSPVIIRAQARQCLSTRDEAKVAAYTHAHITLFSIAGAHKHMPQTCRRRPLAARRANPHFPLPNRIACSPNPSASQAPGSGREPPTNHRLTLWQDPARTDKLKGGRERALGITRSVSLGKEKSKRGDRDSVKERQTMGEIANKHFERGLF